MLLLQVDPLMAQRMATYVVWGVINYQRKMEEYAAAQRRCGTTHTAGDHGVHADTEHASKAVVVHAGAL